MTTTTTTMMEQLLVTVLLLAMTVGSMGASSSSGHRHMPETWSVSAFIQPRRGLQQEEVTITNFSDSSITGSNISNNETQPATPQPQPPVENSHQEGGNLHSKHHKICSVQGGLDLTRLRSREARTLFQGAIEDVELIREYFSEAVTNGGVKGGLSDLSDLAATLDYQGRNLSEVDTTLSAGLGYSDDRRSRRIDRLVSNSTNQPFVGDKVADAAMMDVVSNILPWIVDRKTNEDLWVLDHQNGRSQTAEAEPLVFDKLYTAGYVMSWADAIWYYPPLSQYSPDAPLQIADVLGGNFDSHPIVTGAGFLPDENPEHKSAFFGPYADVGSIGSALITATTPIYYTGQFLGYDNYTYNDTYIAHAGLDISMDSVSALFNDLEDTLTTTTSQLSSASKASQEALRPGGGSFAFLVNTTLSPIVISQSVVGKIYPPLTGMEESRVTYQLSDNSIVDDRRNQTYLVSDTLHQALIDVPSANWSLVVDEIATLARGDRGYMKLNVTLTNTNTPIPYYVMYDRWEYVSDWVLLVLAPVDEVDNAILVEFSEDSFESEVKAGEKAKGTLLLQNKGSLDVKIAPSAWPSWLEFEGETALLMSNPVTLTRGTSMEIAFALKSQGLQVGTSVSTVAFHVVDDKYADCFYDRDVTFDAILKVTPLHMDNNSLGNTVYAGYIFFSVVAATTLGFIAWTIYYWKHRVVRCSQPRFLVMLCCGTILMSSSILTFGVDDDNASIEAAQKACMAAPWLVSMGFITSFSALFSKIWRINKIFLNPRFQRITVTEQDVLVPFAVLFTANFALLLAWTLVDPLRFERIKVDEANPFSDTYGSCQFGENDGTIAIAISILAINFGAVVLACAEAYRAREISDEFSESRWIGITIASWFQVFVVGVPVIFLVNEQPTALYFLKTSIIFVASMSMLLFIFVPKLFIQRRNNVRGSYRSSTLGGSSGFRLPLSNTANYAASNEFGVTESNTSGNQRNGDHGSSLGIKIVGSPTLVMAAKSETEGQLQSRIDELEDTLRKLEEESVEKKLWGNDKKSHNTRERGDCSGTFASEEKTKQSEQEA